MPHLFEPLSIRGVTTRNRIWLAPMCQYSVNAHDGVPTNWHLVHLGARAVGGFGLVLTEATAVTEEGRISPQDTGIWSDEQEAAWMPVTEFIKSHGSVPAIQLAHAGRKASTTQPWKGRVYASPGQGGWEPIGPSPLAYPGLPVPHVMTRQDIEQVVIAFAAAAARAVRAGFEVVEIHGAHGYLLHEFLSPLSNQRDDEFGGSFDNRCRLMRRVVSAVRSAVPESAPVLVRLSATDWMGDVGWTLEDTVELSARLRSDGVDLIDITSGGAVAEQRIEIGPGYQVPFSREVRSRVGVPTGTVGLITESAQAQEVIAAGDADVVLLGRAGLRDAAWPIRAAHELGVSVEQTPYPLQYLAAAYAS